MYNFNSLKLYLRRLPRHKLNNHTLSGGLAWTVLLTILSSSLVIYGITYLSIIMKFFILFPKKKKVSNTGSLNKFLKALIRSPNNVASFDITLNLINNHSTHYSTLIHQIIPKGGLKLVNLFRYHCYDVRYI